MFPYLPEHLSWTLLRKHLHCEIFIFPIRLSWTHRNLHNTTFLDKNKNTLRQIGSHPFSFPFEPLSIITFPFFVSPDPTSMSVAFLPISNISLSIDPLKFSFTLFFIIVELTFINTWRSNLCSSIFWVIFKQSFKKESLSYENTHSLSVLLDHLTKINFMRWIFNEKVFLIH